jgi:hypothetical protein
MSDARLGRAWLYRLNVRDCIISNESAGRFIPWISQGMVGCILSSLDEATDLYRRIADSCNWCSYGVHSTKVTTTT